MKKYNECLFSEKEWLKFLANVNDKKKVNETSYQEPIRDINIPPVTSDSRSTDSNVMNNRETYNYSSNQMNSDMQKIDEKTTNINDIRRNLENQLAELDNLKNNMNDEISFSDFNDQSFISGYSDIQPEGYDISGGRSR